MFQLLKVEIFKNQLILQPWYLHMEKRVVVLEEDLVVDDIPIYIL